MALLFADVLLGLVVEHHDLFALALLDDLALGANAFHHRLADHDFIPAKHQYLKGDLSAYFGIQLFHEDLVASGYLVLFATRTDDCIHGLLPPLSSLAHVRRRPYLAALTKPSWSGSPGYSIIPACPMSTETR